MRDDGGWIKEERVERRDYVREMIEEGPGRREVGRRKRAKGGGKRKERLR